MWVSLLLEQLFVWYGSSMVNERIAPTREVGSPERIGKANRGPDPMLTSRIFRRYIMSVDMILSAEWGRFLTNAWLVRVDQYQTLLGVIWGREKNNYLGN